jgi:putative oxidoreductase
MATAVIASPRQSDWSARLLLVARVIMGIIFVYAAYTKMPWKQPAAFFAMTIDSYQVLPPWAVILVAKILPWFELALGFFLLVGWPLLFVSTLATLVLAGFFSLMVHTYAKGLEINCGCFGPGEHLGPKSLARDGLLLALSLGVTICAFLRHRRRSGRPPLPQA